MITRSIRSLSKPFFKNLPNVKISQPVRHSSDALVHGYTYRAMPPRSPQWCFYVADGINAFMWWWIFVHCWYQPGHVFGEWDIPDPKKFTDAELGVVDDF